MLKKRFQYYKGMLSERQVCDIFQISYALTLAIIVTQDLPFLIAVELAHFAIFDTGISNA